MFVSDSEAAKKFTKILHNVFDDSKYTDKELFLCICDRIIDYYKLTHFPPITES
jgi:hypothetical protein